MNPKSKIKSTPKLTKNNSTNGSSSFLRCCRPLAVDVNMNAVVSVKPARRYTDGSSEPVFTYVKAMEENLRTEEKNDLQIMKKTKNKKKNKVNHKRLLGVLKAIFFETSVARKIRKRKFKEKKNQSKGNDNSMDKESAEVDNGNTSSSSLFSSSSSSSSMITSTLASSSSCSSLKYSSDSNNKSFGLGGTIVKKPKGKIFQVQKQNGKGCYGTNVGLCFILISLLILITWGKLCAIFCSSTWLFFLAYWRIGSSQSSETVPVDSLRLDSEEYKKKIIMKGLLERNHSRGQ